MSLLAELLAGDRRALARAITLVESDRDDHRAEAEALLAALPPAGQTRRIAVSGPPGAGKSSFIEAFAPWLKRAGKLAVLAVDPTSPLSGGAILGDKTRMEKLAADAEVFVRPSPNRLHWGGVGPATRAAIRLCEAAGFDQIVVESVGVGQSEFAVAELVDLVLLLLPPAAGDELQASKRGLLEMANIILLTKADMGLGGEAEMKSALHLERPRRGFWTPPVIPVSAHDLLGLEQVYGEMDHLWLKLEKRGDIAPRRAEQAVLWLRRELLAELARGLAGPAADVVRDVAEGRVDPTVAARRLARG